MPTTVLKAYRLAPETIDTIQQYSRLWSQAKPLSGARVIDEMAKRIREADARKKTSRNSKKDD